MDFNKRKLGNFGESLAADFLKKKKYKIIERNFNNRFGEIDIVAKQKKQLIFVEVKLKTGQEFGLPEEEFNFYKKQKLSRAIKSYLLEKKIKDDNWRVDLVAIGTKGIQKPEIRHYEGVGLT